MKMPMYAPLRPWSNARVTTAAVLVAVNFLFVYALLSALVEDNAPSNVVPMNESIVAGALTVGMLVRNRPHYLETMPMFMNRLTPTLDDAIVVDYGSQPALAPLNASLQLPVRISEQRDGEMSCSPILTGAIQAGAH